jgi:phosphatidylglycerophosphatase A
MATLSPPQAADSPVPVEGAFAIGLLDRLMFALGTGLYVGMIPPRLGTIGALPGIPLAWGLYQWTGWSLYLPVVAILCLAGVYVCSRAEALIGRPDPREVVLDEILTLPITYFLVPSFSWQILLAGFVLHRVWDIAKPLGISRLQQLPRGWGIMADDVAAGILSCICLQVLLRSQILQL